MRVIKIKRGVNIPIKGEPEQEIHLHINPKTVALVGYNYIGLKPTLEASVGDKVKLGQLLFTDKKMPGVKYTSPGSGQVIAINRGPKRAFESIVLELKGDDEVAFKSYGADKLDSLDREEVKSHLIESGLWTSLRARPYSKVADPQATPHSIFVTAIDTNPLAPDIAQILKNKEEPLINGLKVISRLTDGSLFLCKSPQLTVPETDIAALKTVEFSGPHPAGNAGTHIHFLDPVNKDKMVWTIGVQDVIAIGTLFTTGRIDVERIISLAGPAVINPRLIKTRIGASIEDLINGQLTEGENRVISGSLLSGYRAAGTVGYLGRYHQQISALPEDRERKFFGWARPGLDKFSVKNVVLSKLFPRKVFNFTTSLNGSLRAIVPIGSYEKVMPLDILPTFLLRSLMVDDIEEAEKLGCLELDEEDIALCTFVSPSKIDYGPVLRRNLTTIEKEG
jgi:Na+-transporting NADH:ubiquinone oxidoreductase subunit A